jgi:hypothetical protein
MSESKTKKCWTPSWRLFGSIAYGKETLWSFYNPFTRIQIWIMRKRKLGHKRPAFRQLTNRKTQSIICALRASMMTRLDFSKVALGSKTPEKGMPRTITEASSEIKRLKSIKHKNLSIGGTINPRHSHIFR